MKKNFLFAFVLLSALFVGCSENEPPKEEPAVDVASEKLTDEGFKTYCYEMFDTDKDGKLSATEVEAVTKMDCSGRNIKSLSGIEIFTNLIDLTCGFNDLTEIDFSKTPKLTGFNCSSNQGLKSVDMSSLNEFEHLFAAAFKSCKNLETVTFPAGLQSIGDGAFADCKALKKITLPSSLTSIGGSAFLSCSLLETIVFPAKLTSIGADAFLKCTSITSAVLPEGLKSIGFSTFANCSKLETITIPSSLVVLPNSCFRNTAIKEVVIPEGVKNVGHSAFYGCANLTKATFGSTVSQIGASAFEASGLTTVYCHATDVPTLGSNGLGNKLTKVYVPASALDAYKASSTWSSLPLEVEVK